jgi:hypothetical protein
MATTCGQLSVHWDQVREDLGFEWELLLQELSNYIGAAQEAFATRNSLQSEKVKLEKQLADLYAERESGGHSPSPTSLLLDKFDQLKGKT